MHLSIIPVTAKNRAAAERLAVAAGQEHFIEPVTDCLQEADALRDWEPVGLYDGETLVGFAMYGDMRGESPRRLWFDRLLIGAPYQRRGYGRMAVQAVLERLRREFPGRDVYISAYADNPVAIALYESFGFRKNGEKDINGEEIMVLRA